MNSAYQCVLGQLVELRNSPFLFQLPFIIPFPNSIYLHWQTQNSKVHFFPSMVLHEYVSLLKDKFGPELAYF